MSIAADLKILGEDIVASYDTRVKAIGVLAKDTRNILKNARDMVQEFQGEHKEMSAKLKADLAKGEKDRLGDFSAMMAKIQDFVSDVAKEVSTMIKKFQTEHKAMSAELSEDLAKSEADRAKSEADRVKAFKAMMANIHKEVKAVETYVAGKLKEFNADHADMSEALKKELAKYVAGVVSDTRKMLAGFADERESMAANWQALTATMAKKREGQPMKVEAGEKVKTVEEALAKPKKRGRKKGGKRKKKA